MKDPDKDACGIYYCAVQDEYDESQVEKMVLYWDCFYGAVGMKSYDTFEDYQNAFCFHKEMAWCYWEENGYLVSLPGDKKVISWEEYK